MSPLLRRGDTLLVAPSDPQNLHPGDVVVFSNPDRGQIVHRVLAINSQGVTTKGDNNPAADDRILAPREIWGRVTAIQRQGRTLPVPRRVPASLYILKGRRWLDRTVFRQLNPVYHRLAQSCLFKGRLATWIKPELIYLPRSDGPEWQLWLGKFLIGRKMPHQIHWTIRRPFRLFVDEAGLPNQDLIA